MKPFSIPVANTPTFQQRTQLAGKDYTLHFQFNQRLGRWFMDIHDQDDVPIANGVALSAEYPIITSVIDARMPAGVFVLVDKKAEAIDTTPEGKLQASRDCGLAELGDRFDLLFVAL